MRREKKFGQHPQMLPEKDQLFTLGYMTPFFNGNKVHFSNSAALRNGNQQNITCVDPSKYKNSYNTEERLSCALICHHLDECKKQNIS